MPDSFVDLKCIIRWQSGGDPGVQSSILEDRSGDLVDRLCRRCCWLGFFGTDKTLPRFGGCCRRSSSSHESKLSKLESASGPNCTFHVDLHEQHITSLSLGWSLQVEPPPSVMAVDRTETCVMRDTCGRKGWFGTELPCPYDGAPLDVRTNQFTL